VALAEVKYQSKIDESQVRTLARAGGGLAVSRDLEGSLANGSVYALPAGALLAALDAPALAKAPT
jgi:hypothetical protein